MKQDRASADSDGRAAFASFRIVMQLEAKHLTPARHVIANIAQSIDLDAEVASRLALAAHELLENAVKYSAAADRQVLLRLSIVRGSKASVTVCNASSREIYQRMQRRLRRLNRETDAAAYYQALIVRTMARQTGSGLGLARIRAEAEMKLYCAFRGDVLSVRAELTTGASR